MAKVAESETIEQGLAEAVVYRSWRKAGTLLSIVANKTPKGQFTKGPSVLRVAGFDHRRTSSGFKKNL